MKRILMATVLANSLLGCQGSVNNRIGYEWTKNSEYKASCVRQELSKITNLNDLNSLDNGFSFTIARYTGRLTNREATRSRSAYYLDLDGMFLGESYKIFIQNAESIKKEIITALEKNCSD